jgi:hypothetical protein
MIASDCSLHIPCLLAALAGDIHRPIQSCVSSTRTPFTLLTIGQFRTDRDSGAGV